VTRHAVWIDDDADAFPAVGRLLRQEGLEVTIFYNVAEALAGVDKLARAELILLDLVIPAGRDADVPPVEHMGLWLLERLRKGFKIETPVIVFSIIPEGTVLLNTRDLGVAEFVEKPAGLTSLRAAIARGLAPRASDELL
jgi:CheY-like chemotaxis protein